VKPLQFLLFAFFLLTSHLGWAGTAKIQLVSSYVYPGVNVSYTLGGAVASNGIIVGTFGKDSGRVAGYERGNGRFIEEITFPGSVITSAYGVNTNGVVSGTFNSDADHGFFFSRGKYTQYDVAGAIHTNVTGVNDAGDFCGYYFTDAAVITPFLNARGLLISFDIPGIDVVYARAINNLGQVAGGYVDPSDPQVEHGFLRDADGTLTYPLDYPASLSSPIFGLNDKGVLVGTYRDSSLFWHAFALRLPDEFVSYDYPHGDYSTFRGINNTGTISGDALNGTYHAFVARIRFGN
jgi:hypothetical protein